MATLTPSAADGIDLLASPPDRPHDDDADRESGGSFVHNNWELSAQELYELWCMVLALGEAGAVRVLNEFGSTAPAGCLVKLSGYDDTAGAFQCASADADTKGLDALFVLPAEIADDGTGLAVRRAEVSGLDTSGASEGDPVYLASGPLTLANWTLSEPALPARSQVVGYVREVGASGTICFDLTERQSILLGDARDVDLTGLDDGDMLIWSSAGSKWITAAPTDTDEKVKADASDTSAGYLSDKVDDTTIEVTAADVIAIKALSITDSHINASAAIAWSKISKSGAVASDVGAAASSHNHSTADLNSGTLSLDRQSNPSKEDHTSGDTLTNADRYVLHTNAGASAEVELTLPDPASGVGPFRFVCMDTDGLKVRLPTSFKARVGSSETSAAGYLLSTAVGSTLDLYPLYDAGETAWKWVALSAVRTWSAA